jgi:hypothetical protein
LSGSNGLGDSVLAALGVSAGTGDGGTGATGIGSPLGVTAVTAGASTGGDDAVSSG